MHPLITPEVTQRWANRYIKSNGAVAQRQEATAALPLPAEPQDGALAWQKRMEAVIMSEQQNLPRKTKAPNPPGYLRLSVMALLITALAVITGCAQQPPEGKPAEDPTVTPSAAGTPASSIDLSIALTQSPGAAPRQFRLVADGSTPAPESTLPDPAAALAAVEAHGQKMFFPVPDPTRACTQQYGGPEIAVVTGWFNGKEVDATFKRTDGCEIARWQALAPLLGALAGGTGAI